MFYFNNEEYEACNSSYEYKKFSVITSVSSIKLFRKKKVNK